MSLACPRCPEVQLFEGQGVLHEAICPSCQGRFLDDGASRRLLEDELGLHKEMLEELASLFGGLALPCPGCEQRTRPVTIRSVPVDLCFGCGGLWCDAGELERISGARYREVQLGGQVAAPADDVDDRSKAKGTAPNEASAGRLRAGGAAVFLRHSAPVEADTLWRALGSFSQYSRSDMKLLSRRAMGIVLDGVSKVDATLVAQSLGEDGHEAIVDDARWAESPAPHQPRRLEVHDDGLTFIDMHEHRYALRWPEVLALNIGNVGRRDKSAQNLTVRDAQDVVYMGKGRTSTIMSSTGVYNALRSASQKDSFGLVLDVIGIDGRVHMTAQSAVSLHGHLQQGPSRFDAALKHIAAKLSQRAPGPVFGSGARAFANGDPLVTYRDVRLFEREVAWTAWAAARQNGAERST